ncbi:unnamed protein product [marine sediment metagenome]|uniref:Uncharacterized protein n=1 Tax=marine sediment metagenome TaxID=412755 RepID=X0SAN0_9ZZZZ
MSVGFVAVAVDGLRRHDSNGGGFFWNHIWGVIGVSLVVVATVSWLAVYFTTRCPFCGKWIDPWYYPRPGFHCPKCGKTND